VLRPEVTAFISLGANLGEPLLAVRAALESLGTAPGVRLVNASSLYRTAPQDSSGPDYINAVAEVTTTLCAPALLDALQAIEQGAGRERPYRNAPRTLDLDLLLYGAGRIDSPRLSVPHPRLWQRAFVLLPLAEIAPSLVSATQLEAVADQTVVIAASGAVHPSERNAGGSPQGGSPR
jgi:2-amino-4-hydroxy-6-hydroxymethyldihydropteridine diphosphokinase